jgi:hypothetical protein
MTSLTPKLISAATGTNLRSSEIQLTSGQASPLILAPGRVLNVEVERQDGKTGILIQGRFFAAKLPDAAVDGQKLQVQVQGSGDTLTLKVLNQAPQPNLVLSQSIQELLKQLLPNIDMRSLRGTLQNLETKIPESVLAKIFGQVIAQAGTNTQQPSIDPQLATQLQQLFGGQQFLTDKQIANPKALEQFLTQYFGAGLLKGVHEALETVQKLSQQSPAANQIRFLEILESTLRAIQEQPETLSFSSPSNSGIVGQQLRLYLLASHAAIERQDSTTLAQINQDLTLLRKLDNPLVLLRNVLGMMDFGEKLKNTFGAAVNDLAYQIISNLADAERRAAPEAELRSIAKKYAQLSRALLEQHKANAAQGPLLQDTGEALKALERLAQGQQTLNQINPVMHALGEPILLLFPALTHGLLSKWQLSVTGSAGERIEGESQRRKQENSNEFERVELRLSFPQLGATHINLAHREGEILLNITTSSEEAAQHLQAELPKLESIFTTLGFKKVGAKVQMGEVKDALPKWYTELSKHSFIA